MKTILAATDLTSNCDRAVLRAIEIAKLTDAALHIVHVMNSKQGKTEDGSDLLEMQKSQIERYLVDYKDSAEGVDVVVSVNVNDNEFSEILLYAKDHDADLIVMGMHNKVGFKDLFIGTTIERVISRGVVPVLMVRDQPLGAYESIVYGADFSDAATKALSVALEIADGADLSVIHTYSFPDTTTGDKIEVYAGDVLVQIEEGKFEEHKAKLDDMIEKLSASVKEISYDLIKGNVQESLLAKIDTKGRVLLAIGGHSRTSFFRSKLGGTAHDLMTNPPCDILVSV